MNNRLFTGVLLALCGLFSCTSQEQRGYQIDGTIIGTVEGKVYLKRYEDKTFTTVDSAVIVNSHFSFHGNVNEPVVYGLTTEATSRQPLIFFLENSKLKIQLDEDKKQIQIEGSSLNDLFIKESALVERDDYRIDSLADVHSASPVVPYFLMRHFVWKLTLEQTKEIRKTLSPSLDGSVYVTQLDTLIARRDRLQVGKVAPDFSLPDVDGNVVTLSSFRGKYVLVDFWASWCPDCRKENPNIVEAYRRFKNHNFTVLGVSLDRKREPWLTAIEKDNLTWIHVTDLKDWKSEVALLYAIRWIPTSYLLDPDGVIIAVGLEGQALQDKLEEVLLIH